VRQRWWFSLAAVMLASSTLLSIARCSTRTVLDPGPARKVASGVVWYAWSGDGRIVFATKTAILLLDPKSGHKRSIFSTYRIGRVFISPNRSRLAVAVGKELFLVRLDGMVDRRIKLKGWLQDAAWSSGSDRIAYASGNVIWVCKPGGRASVLTRQTTTRDAWSDSGVQRPTLRVTGLSWSTSDKSIAYRAYYRGEETTGPNLVVVDARNGGRRTVVEGYSQEDGHYSWAPAGDWMAVTGSLGDPDTCIWLQRAWSPQSIQIENYGTGSTFLESDWQPLASAWAVHLLNDPGGLGSSGEPIDTILVYRLDPSKPPLWMTSPEQKANLPDLVRKLASARATRALSTIPDFDWSPDGSNYVHVERICTDDQLAEAQASRKTGRHYELRLPEAIAYLKLQSANGAQDVVFAKGERPSSPQFSPDGKRLSYISGRGALIVRSVK
jgi:hypothetical protein